MKRATTETREAFAAILALGIRYKRAMANERMGYLELAGFLRDVPGIKRGFENIHLVPAEMLDLEEDEMPGLVADIVAILKTWGIQVSHRTQDIISADVPRGLARMVPHLQAIKFEWDVMMSEIEERPPVALPE